LPGDLFFPVGGKGGKVLNTNSDKGGNEENKQEKKKKGGEKRNSEVFQ